MPSETCLGSLTLRPGRQLLRQGQPIALGRKALAILTELATANGALLTKDELLAAVWPGMIVEENALQVHVAALRKALGSEAGRLQTIRGLGYRLDTENQAHGAPAPSDPVATPSSVAVLPFTNLTGDPAMDYLSDGLAAELIATLSHGSGLRVPSYTSSHAYKGKAVDLRQIGKELGVGSILEGEVKAGPNRIRVHAQLIDVSTGFYRWSDSFDRHPSDLLQLQEELAVAIATALRTHLAPARRASTSSAAFDLYLKGRALENNISHANICKAAELYRQAVSLDNDFAPALARLAGVLCFGLVIGTFSADALQEARSAAERAIACDPSLATCHAAMASVSMRQGDWQLAHVAHQRAVSCGPADAQALLARGSFLATAGYLNQARELFELAAEIEPTNTRATLYLATFYSLAGNDETCARWVENAIALGSSADEVPITQIRAKEALVKRNPGSAARLWVSGLPQSVIEAGLEDVSQIVFEVCLGSGGREGAVRALETFWASARVQKLLKRGSPLVGMIIELHARLDDVDGIYRIAAHVLRGLQEANHLDEACARMIWTHNMDSFREDSRFTEFVDRLGLMTFWRRNGWPDLWSPEGSRPLADLVREWNAAV